MSVYQSVTRLYAVALCKNGLTDRGAVCGKAQGTVQSKIDELLASSRFWLIMQDCIGIIKNGRKEDNDDDEYNADKCLPLDSKKNVSFVTHFM